MGAPRSEYPGYAHWSRLKVMMFYVCWTQVANDKSELNILLQNVTITAIVMD